tara:strand:+ start:1703 stop:1927 length:225 start_codon:yes stop_codon:yes gene_type:complete
MKNKYDIGYLAWDKHDNVYGIIIKVVDNGPRHHAHSRWGYYIRWSDQKIETYDLQGQIKIHPNKKLIIHDRIPF